MKAIECVREKEVIRAVLTRRWPGGAERDLQSELQRHAASCEICAEVVMVATVLSERRDEALRDVHVPAAGQVWWRAAVRAHAEAAQAARRPMVWLQGIAGACAVGLGAAMIRLAWPSIREAAAWISALSSDLDLYVPEIATLVEALQPGLPLALAAVACLVLMPLVVYFALSDD
jgi:hypothetical protein